MNRHNFVNTNVSVPNIFWNHLTAYLATKQDQNNINPEALSAQGANEHHRKKIKELTKKIAFNPKLKARKPARKTPAEVLHAPTYGEAKATLASIASRMPNLHTT